MIMFSSKQRGTVQTMDPTPSPPESAHVTMIFSCCMFSDQKQIVGWRAAPLIGSAALLIKDAQLKGMLDDVRPLKQHFQASDNRGRFITPQGYRNAVSTYDPEKQIYKIPISDLVPIMEEREK